VPDVPSAGQPAAQAAPATLKSRRLPPKP
jgi:hypothetical protein